MSKPITVEKTSRQVIERKLLAALEEGDQVAILATKDDLEVLIAALLGYKVAEKHDNVLSWIQYEDRRKELGKDLQRLRREAFP